MLTREEALEILGLTPNATVDEIDRRRRILLARLHPDKARSDEEREVCDFQAKRINAACDVLRRSSSDRSGSTSTHTCDPTVEGAEGEPWQIARGGQVVARARSRLEVLQWYMQGRLSGVDYLFHSSLGKTWVPLGATPFGSALAAPNQSTHAFLAEMGPWPFCGVHGCQCELAKGCAERTCRCGRPKFCVADCACGAPKACANPFCSCQRSRIATATWAHALAAPTVWTCSSCRRNVPEDAIHCPYCGASFTPAARAGTTVSVSQGAGSVILTVIIGLFSFVWRMSWSLARSMWR
jgi:hypothetical protein